MMLNRKKREARIATLQFNMEAEGGQLEFETQVW
jgi:hypothetical protein